MIGAIYLHWSSFQTRLSCNVLGQIYLKPDTISLISTIRPIKYLYPNVFSKPCIQQMQSNIRQYEIESHSYLPFDLSMICMLQSRMTWDCLGTPSFESTRRLGSLRASRDRNPVRRTKPDIALSFALASKLMVVFSRPGLTCLLHTFLLFFFPVFKFASLNNAAQAFFCHASGRRTLCT